MKPSEKIEKMFTQINIETNTDVDKVVLGDAVNAMSKSKQKTPASNKPDIWRIIMKTKITKFATAAIFIAVAILSINLLDKTAAPAYALEQTIEALNTMRSIHVRMYYPGYEEPVLVWANFYEDGQIKALRVSQSKLAPGDPHDGPKEAVFKNNTAQVWLKEKNMVFKIYDQMKAAEIGAFFQEVDPKLLVQKLQQMQDQGTAQIEIEQPDQIDQPIIVTATFTVEDSLFGSKAIALVDQATKLVISLETIKGDGTFDPKTEHFGMNDFNQLEFFDYNQIFQDDIFTLTVPEDVLVIDQLTNKVGLSPGSMSIEETAIEVVKRFLQSIIDEDYETAGLMYGGLPGEKIEQNFGKQPDGEILKVISIGTANIHPNPDYKNKAFVVPCTIEFIKNGQIEQKTFRCIVKEVDGQQGQWAICGGI